MSEKVRPARPGTGLTEDGRRLQVLTTYARRGQPADARAAGRLGPATSTGGSSRRRAVDELPFDVRALVRARGAAGRRDRVGQRRGGRGAGGAPAGVQRAGVRGLASRRRQHVPRAGAGGHRQRPAAVGGRRLVAGAPRRARSAGRAVDVLPRPLAQEAAPQAAAGHARRSRPVAASRLAHRSAVAAGDRLARLRRADRERARRGAAARGRSDRPVGRAADRRSSSGAASPRAGRSRTSATDGSRDPSSACTAARNTSVCRSTSACGVVRREQRHVVERRQQDPAVERPQVHEALELLVDRGGSRGPVARRRAEPVLRPAAELLHVPGQAGLLDDRRDAVGPPGRQRDRDREVLLAQGARQRRPGRGQGERAAGQGAADPGDVDLVALHRRLDPRGHRARSCRTPPPARRRRSACPPRACRGRAPRRGWRRRDRRRACASRR